MTLLIMMITVWLGHVGLDHSSSGAKNAVQKDPSQKTKEFDAHQGENYLAFKVLYTLKFKLQDY